MESSTGASIRECFGELTDPRTERKIRHVLLDIITLALCAGLSGADTWVDAEDCGKAKREWFETIRELPNGIPSHDSFGRVFSLLSPTEL